MKSRINKRAGHQSEGSALPNSIDEALGRYWKSLGIQGIGNGVAIPDYHGFQTWFFESFDRLQQSPTVPIHLTAGMPAPAGLLEQLAYAIDRAGLQVTETGLHPIKGRFPAAGKGLKAIKAINKAKLLLSLSDGFSNRGLDLLRSLTSKPFVFPAAAETTETSSPFEHRAAFFRAIAERDAKQAFKMLGRLRICDHDPGELDYLEALAEFHSGDLDLAIAHGRKVPVEAIDFPRAQLLIVEAHALKGDVVAFKNDLSSIPSSSLSPYFLPYVWQTAVRNSDDPEGLIDEALQAASSSRQISAAGSGAYHSWNQQSCELAMQLVEHRRDQHLRAAAVEQGGDQDLNSSADTPIAVRQVAAAVRLDEKLHSAIGSLDADHASREIVKRLINHGSPTARDFVQALRCQWRIGNRADFVENVLRSVDALLGSCGPDGIQIVGVAYREALVMQKEEVVETLRVRLPHLASETEAPMADILQRQASPMGRLALQAACHDLLAIEQGGNAWRDAGMMSLGFFRVLELELNHRVILPLLNSHAAADVMVAVAQLRAAAQSNQVKRAIEFWESVVGSKKGLELGRAEIFLDKIRSSSGCDAAIKSLFRTSLLPLLSSEGVVAFNNGDLSRLVNTEARERFRNPPAHTRYVGLPRAREAKTYVENALLKLFSWTALTALSDQTIH